MSKAVQSIVDQTSDLIIRAVDLGNVKLLIDILVSAEDTRNAIEKGLMR
jgi:hypothetical protein